MEVLRVVRPGWERLRIHESSPTIALFSRCAGYSFSHFFEGTPRGGYVDGVRCEDLEGLTFADGAFDVFVTQDVLEHVFEPQRALREIVRCLRPGGIHVFTTPKHRDLLKSRCRAERRGSGVAHLLEPVFHGNPVGDGKALVTWDFGADFEELAQGWGGHLVSTYVIRDRARGIDGEFLEVFVQEKSDVNAVRPAAAAASPSGEKGQRP